MTVTTSVRSVRAGEAAAAAELVTAAGLPTEGLEQAWVTLVTEDAAGELVGTATLERYGAAGSPVFLLRSVAVRDDRRGTGLGAALVGAALDAADRDAGMRATVGLLTGGAAGYYDRFGFVAVPRDQLPPALSGSPELTRLCPAGARAHLRT